MHNIKKTFRIWTTRHSRLLDQAFTVVSLAAIGCFMAYITLGFLDLL